MCGLDGEYQCNISQHRLPFVVPFGVMIIIIDTNTGLTSRNPGTLCLIHFTKHTMTLSMPKVPMISILRDWQMKVYGIRDTELSNPRCNVLYPSNNIDEWNGMMH